MSRNECFYSRVILLGCLLLVALSPLLGCGLTKQTTTREVTLSAGQYMTVPFNLEAGDLVEGSFTVLGPSNLDIKFAIQDPAGRNVYGPIRSRSGSFTYRAQTTGRHHFYIDNTYSLFSEKAVSLTYTRPRR
jgi:hypothetical protein